MRYIFIILIFSFANISFADQELDYCLEMSKKTNSNFPLKIDDFITAKGSGCKKSSPNIFQYYYYIEKEVMPEQLSLVSQLLKDAKPNFLKNWCSNPDMLLVLGLYDVEYVYRDIKEQYLGSVEIKERDCKK